MFRVFSETVANFPCVSGILFYHQHSFHPIYFPLFRQRTSTSQRHYFHPQLIPKTPQMLGMCAGGLANEVSDIGATQSGRNGELCVCNDYRGVPTCYAGQIFSFLFYCLLIFSCVLVFSCFDRLYSEILSNDISYIYCSIRILLLLGIRVECSKSLQRC